MFASMNKTRLLSDQIWICLLTQTSVQAVDKSDFGQTQRGALIILSNSFSTFVNATSRRNSTLYKSNVIFQQNRSDLHAVVSFSTSNNTQRFTGFQFWLTNINLKKKKENSLKNTYGELSEIDLPVLVVTGYGCGLLARVHEGRALPALGRHVPAAPVLAVHAQLLLRRRAGIVAAVRVARAVSRQLVNGTCLEGWG